jgi:hypothetical protein
MDASRVLIAQEFKQVLSKIIDEIVNKLKIYKGSLPIPVEFIDFGVTLFKTQACPEKSIESFIERCFPDEDLVKDLNGSILKDKDGKPINVWDQIKVKNETVLIEIGRKMFEQQFPMLAVQGTQILSFVLKNRTELLGEELEDKLWKIGEDLIQKAIKYTHLRRHPKINPETGISQYTMRFAPKMKVKDEAKKWNVDL